jgi:thioredoxin reductase
VIEGTVASLSVHGDRLTGIQLTDGTVIRCEALPVSARMVARAGFLTGLGLAPTQHPSRFGEHIPADATGRTAVPGIWAAGNVTDLAGQVGASAAGRSVGAATSG